MLVLTLKRANYMGPAFDNFTESNMDIVIFDVMRLVILLKNMESLSSAQILIEIVGTCP